MQYIITAIVSVFPLFLREDKRIRYIQLIWLWILIGGCCFNVDTPGYRSVFDNIEQVSWNIEMFYNLFCLIFVKLGLSYQAMVMAWSLFFIIILDRGITKLTDEPQKVYSCMFIYPLIDNIVQLKNFAGFAVLVYALQYLLKDDVKSSIKYFLLICFATIQHSSYIIYIFLGLVPIIRRRKKYLIVYVLTLPVVAVVLPKFIDVFGRMITTDAVVDIYVSSLTNKTTLVILIVWQMAAFFLTYWFAKGNVLIRIGKQSKFRYSVNEYEKNVIDLIIAVDVLMMVICSFYVVDAIFQRLARNLLTLDTIAFSILWKYQEEQKEKNAQKIIWFLYMATSALMFYVLTGNAWEANKLALENNIFWMK